MALALAPVPRPPKRANPVRSDRMERKSVPTGELSAESQPIWTMFLAAIIASGLAASPARSETGWSVRSFDVSLSIHPDAGLDVTETIDAEFDVPKHGIYREIPIRYAVGLHQYALRFQLLGVDDGADRNYGTKVTFEENRIRIRVGDANQTIKGAARFRIHYRVLRAIIWERNRAWAEAAPDQDRAVLRWVATGTEWGVPIHKATVTVHLPQDLDDSHVDYDAWTGAYGSRNKDFTKRRVQRTDDCIRDRHSAARRVDHDRRHHAGRRRCWRGLDARALVVARR